MRTIVKRQPPNSLTTWRRPRLATNKPDGMECSYDEMRRDRDVLQAIEDGLYAEQGGICAYTGLRILLTETADGTRRTEFHIEHLKSQDRCRRLESAVYGEDADYRNLVACWPRANYGYEAPYGAHAKKSWPAAAEHGDFVSPLQPSCEQRFRFKIKGSVEPANQSDTSAQKTIEHLGLDHPALRQLRRAAIKSALGATSYRRTAIEHMLKLMRRESKQVNSGVNQLLDPFCFVIIQELERRLRKQTP